MHKVVGLFSDAQDVEKFTQRMADDKFNDLDVEVLESSETVERPPIAPASAGGVTSNISAGAVPFGKLDDNIFEKHGVDEETAQFLKHGVNSGGTVVIVDVDNDRHDAVRQEMVAHNGRFAAES